MIKMVIIGKHLGNLSVDCPWAPHWHHGGSGQRWKRKGGDRAREILFTETERGSGKERASYSSLCSLNEVFFLFFCVCVVALSVDDGCVGVRRIVRPFGLVCQVCSWGSEKQTCIRENKCQAAPHDVCCLRRRAHLKTTSVMLHNSYTE